MKAEVTEPKVPISKKTKVIILVIVVLLLAGGAAYYFAQKADKKKLEEEKKQEEELKEQPKEPATITDTKTILIQQEKADKAISKQQLEVAPDADKSV